MRFCGPGSQGFGAIATGSASTAAQNGDIAMGMHASTQGAGAGGNIAIGSATDVVAGALAPSTAVATTATGGNSVAIGTGATSANANSVALGAGSVTTAANEVSVGSAGQTRAITHVTAGTDATDAVNVGQLAAAVGSLANGAQITAVQAAAQDAAHAATAAQATADQAVIAGQANAVQIRALVSGQAGVCTVIDGAMQCSVQGQAAAQAQGQGAMAMGVGAQAEGEGTVAQGRNAQARYAGSVAIGDGARATADPTTAVGSMAIAAGDNSVALGANTLANGDNSVARGQGSVADRDQSVSIGNAAALRQLTHLAPGTAGTDAVNLDQLRQMGAATFGDARRFASRAAAQAMAMPNASIPAGRTHGLAASTATYAGYAALGVEYAQRVTANLQLQLGASFSSGGQAATRATAMLSW